MVLRLGIYVWLRIGLVGELGICFCELGIYVELGSWAFMLSWGVGHLFL
jgi:hypothetical protein